MQNDNPLILSRLLPSALRFRELLRNSGQLNQFETQIDELLTDVSNISIAHLEKINLK